jgi:hypothetical protein
VLDANGDGRLDLFVLSTDGHVYARNLRGLARPLNPQWAMWGGGPGLSGAFDPSRLPLLPSAAGQVLSGPVVIFPNPVRSGDENVRIRYTLAANLEPATNVEINVYNLAGEKMDSMQGTIFPNSENVVSMPASELASGVYVCSIRARSGGRTETSTEKFAVIR